MPVPIQHTIKKVVERTNGNVGTTPVVELFPANNGVVKDCVSVSICNTHASQDIYVQLEDATTANTLSTSIYDEKIPAGESRQFQVLLPNPDGEGNTRIYILGSGATTTYTAKKYI